MTEYDTACYGRKTIYLAHLAHASETKADAMFFLWFKFSTGSHCSLLFFSPSHEHKRVSRPFKQSPGSLLKLNGAQSCRQPNNTLDATPQRWGSILLWDCSNGSTNSTLIRVEKEACSGSFQRPCFFKIAIVSSVLLLSLSFSSSWAICFCAFQSPFNAFNLYSSSFEYALLWVPQTDNKRWLSSAGFFKSNVITSLSPSEELFTSLGNSTRSVTRIKPSCKNNVSSVTDSHWTFSWPEDAIFFIFVESFYKPTHFPSGKVTPKLRTVKYFFCKTQANMRARFAYRTMETRNVMS